MKFIDSKFNHQEKIWKKLVLQQFYFRLTIAAEYCYDGMFNADDKYDVYSGGFCDVFTLQDIKDRDLIFQFLFLKHKSMFSIKFLRLKVSELIYFALQ